VSQRASVDDTAIVDELEARTDLDRGQYRALITATLTRDFVFIQGRHRTGQSHLGMSSLCHCVEFVFRIHLSFESAILTIHWINSSNILLRLSKLETRAAY